MNASPLRHPLALAILWMLALFVTVAVTRPAIPIDETRYLTVAWEYYARGEWILPTLNGAPYDHKPPILFWLINLVWRVIGTTPLWAARLVPLAATLATLALTTLLARTLWPDDNATRRLTPLVLIGTPFFALYGTLIMFDMLLAVAVLIGLYALLRLRQGGARAWWLLFGTALGLGALIKGPVVLLHLLPVALLAPLWHKADPAPNHHTWYQGIIFAIGIGVLLALTWAIPAAKLGGPEYADMIFWGQSAGRMVSSFDHAQPFWFYLVLLPACLLPWWLALLRWPQRQSLRETLQNLSWQTRFILCWTLPGFIAFMFISGKQAHYLLPLLPGIALLLTHVLAHSERCRAIVPARLYLIASAPALILTAILLSLEVLDSLISRMGKLGANLAIQVADTHIMGPLTGLILMIALLVALHIWRHRVDLSHTIAAIAGTYIIFIAAFHLSTAPLLAKYYDLTPAGKVVHDASALGGSTAVLHKWQGELGYLARLTRPITILPNEDAIKPWLKKNPNGLVILRHPSDQPPYGFRVLYTQPYRSADRSLTIITTTK